MSPRIDPDLQALIPPLAVGERTQLEASLLAEGCRDPLVVWEGHDILLDGHHRLAACEAHDLPYTTTAVALPDAAAARAWVIQNQFARRNLSPYQRAELALQLEPLVATEAKERQREGGARKVVQNSAQPREKTRVVVAKAAGVSHDTIDKVRAIRDRADDQTKARVRAGEISIHAAYQKVKRRETEECREARREANRRRVEQAPSVEAAVSEAKFATILVDPPWDYGGGWDLYGRGLPEYQTMPIEDLLELPLGELADEDSHLYLWVTNRLLPQGFTLVEAWGFRYVTCLTWCKPHFGMGQYFRGQTEHVLFGVRGSQELKRKDVGTWFQAAAGPKGHSSKPEEFHELVESCSPGPYLEVFARSQREGWTAWGGELVA